MRLDSLANERRQVISRLRKEAASVKNEQIKISRNPLDDYRALERLFGKEEAREYKMLNKKRDKLFPRTLGKRVPERVGKEYSSVAKSVNTWTETFRGSKEWEKMEDRNYYRKMELQVQYDTYDSYLDELNSMERTITSARANGVVSAEVKVSDSIVADYKTNPVNHAELLVRAQKGFEKVIAAKTAELSRQVPQQRAAGIELGADGPDAHREHGVGPPRLGR